MRAVRAGGERTQVGIVHNWMPYEAKRSRAGFLVWWPAVLMRLADHCCARPSRLAPPACVPVRLHRDTQLLARWELLQQTLATPNSNLGGGGAGGNREILGYLRTGVLHWQPFGRCTRVRHVRREGPPPLDWIGLNYYSRVVLDWRCQVVAYPWEKLSDLKQAIYPAGFYNVRPPLPAALHPCRLARLDLYYLMRPWWLPATCSHSCAPLRSPSGGARQGRTCFRGRKHAAPACALQPLVGQVRGKKDDSGVA